MKYRTKYQSRIHFLLFRFYSYSVYRCAINCNYIYASLHFCNITEEWKKKTQTKFIEKKVELDSISRRCIRLNKLMHCIISRLSNQRILEITHAHTFMPHQILSLRTLALCNRKNKIFTTTLQRLGNDITCIIYSFVCTNYHMAYAYVPHCGVCNLDFNAFLKIMVFIGSYLVCNF